MPRHGARCSFPSPTHSPPLVSTRHRPFTLLPAPRHAQGMYWVPLALLHIGVPLFVFSLPLLTPTTGCTSHSCFPPSPAHMYVATLHCSSLTDSSFQPSSPLGYFTAVLPLSCLSVPALSLFISPLPLLPLFSTRSQSRAGMKSWNILRCPVLWSGTQKRVCV